MRILRAIVILLLAGLVGLAGYAYFGDMSADTRPVRVPVELDMGTPPTTGTATPAPGPPTPGAAGTDPATRTDSSPLPKGANDASLD